MLAAVIKSFFAKVAGVKPSHIVSCSIMPCVRKQGEADREWFGEEEGAGEGDACNMVVRDLDHVITTAELGKIFQEQGINLAVRCSRGHWRLAAGDQGWRLCHGCRAFTRQGLVAEARWL